MQDNLQESPVAKRQRRLSLHDLKRIHDKLCEDESQQPLFDQIVSLIPSTDPERIQELIDEKSLIELLQPGTKFADYEVWINSSETNAVDVAYQVRAAGADCRLVSQSIMVVADMWIVYRGALVLEVIERKTLKDFMGSILDGRYMEQPQRIIKTGAPFKYWLVIGSPIQQLDNMEDRQSIATASSTITHTYPGIILEQITEQSLLGKTLANHLVGCRHFFEGSELYEKVPAVETIRTQCKVRQLDNQKNVWLVWLCAVKGMGASRARAVMERYGSISQYIEAAGGLTSAQRPLMLQDIQVPKLNGAGSIRLGPALSKRIFQCVFTAEEIAN